jgi:sulfoxide reductase heme-binding subunit YedZ
VRQLSDRSLAWVKAGVFLACLLPLVRLGVLGVTDGLTANPIEFITRSTGTWTLVMLLATLTVTPLRRALAWPWLIRLRRVLGLYAFFYACLHLVTYLWLDQFFDLAAIVRDIVKRGGEFGRDCANRNCHKVASWRRLQSTIIAPGA